MKMLWNIVNGFEMKSATKFKVYLCILTSSNIVIGALAWLLVGRWFLSGIDWLLCFMGYPAMFIGLLGGVLYLCSHEFA